MFRGNVAERLGLVGTRLRREAEHALAEDVALHLLGAAADATVPLVEEELLPEAVLVRVAGVEHGVGAFDRHREIGVERECSDQKSLATELSGPGLLPVRTARLAHAGPSHLRSSNRVYSAASRWRMLGSWRRPYCSGEASQSAKPMPPPDAADHRALVHQRGLGDAPAVAHAAEQVVGGDAHVGEERLVEVRDAGDLPQRACLDARRASCRRGSS